MALLYQTGLGPDREVATCKSHYEALAICVYEHTAKAGSQQLFYSLELWKSQYKLYLTARLVTWSVTQT